MRSAARWISHRPARHQLRRNLLWLLFTDPALHARMDAWEEQAPLMLSSFRRDFARATQEADIHTLVDELERVSPEFKA
ncbi:hypothetical protein [Salinicola peritrichatus]|uniref:MmyB family transcriptional regulator n=1 Tax=Salinicola peritrichatus TaxID=1267424 RepID=UPI001EF8C990|nr:hypothetical protein [Salinicola peritrichatus]